MHIWIQYTIYNIGKLLALHTYILYIFIMKVQLYDHINSYICTLNQQARLAEDCQPIILTNYM